MRSESSRWASMPACANDPVHVAMNNAPEDYRHAPIRCVICGATMDRLQRGDAVIDRCPTCGGMWIDWYDGDAVGVLQGLPESGGQVEGQRSSECPRCRGALLPEPFRDDGPEVFRCNQCFGMFVPGEAVGIIAALRDKSADRTALGRWIERVLWKSD